LAATGIAVEAYCRLLDRAALSSADRGGADLAWTTPNRVALELSSMQLRDFSQSATAGPPVLVCAPYALHSAQIADFAPGHSIVEALRREGLDRVHVTDWRSATSEMRHFGIDAYLSDLNVAVDEIGAPVDLVGLCQGGWLSLIYAARFPQKVRRLVLAGAPVDVSVPSELSRTVAQTPQPAFEGMVTPSRGVVSGEYTLRVWTKSFSAREVGTVLQRDLSAENELLDRFRRWDNATLDLPGAYFLQVVSWIFRQNRLAGGDFVALGRKISLAEVKTPVFLLAGASDEVVPAEQAFATAPLLGAPPVCIERAGECSRHLSLFLGCQTLSHSWSRVAQWLKRDMRDLDSAA
jgi:poly(3-hydroxyalkanoate) synthetase